MSIPILELRGISKQFPGVRALDDVSFAVNEGEVHALLGENGAGKSTLIKVMTGAYRPDQGTLLLSGKQVELSGTSHSQALGIAAIYQELSLYPELTIAENIFMGHQPRTRLGLIDWRAMERQSRELLHELDASELDVTQKVGGLSVGNQQRIEIAKALSQNARILIMDEPTAALTQHDVERLFAIVRRLRERGVAVIYISHRLEEVFLLAQHVTVLRDGQVAGTRPVGETDQGELIRLMVGRNLDALFPKQQAEIGPPVLEARGLNRGRRVRDVSFTLRRGEIVGLAGLVGAGRSELANVLFGITPAEGGSIAVGGQQAQIRSPQQAMSLGIGYVPEDRKQQGLILPMSVGENTTLAILQRVARLGLIDRRSEQQIATEYVDRLRIRTPSIAQLARNLSGGNQQKIVIAKWLARSPSVLILDEPTRGIDVGAKAEIHRLMSSLAQQGLAILMISSELPEILGMSDRVLVMRQGQIVATFDRAEATQEKIVGAAMGSDGDSFVSVVAASPPQR